MPDSELTRRVIGCAIEVHRNLGPGLLEELYEACLCEELIAAGLEFVRQKSLPVVYKGKALDGHYTMDIIVRENLVLEIKAVDQVLPIHEAQLQTYLRLSGLPLGLLMNFSADRMKDGISCVIGPDVSRQCSSAKAQPLHNQSPHGARPRITRPNHEHHRHRPSLYLDHCPLGQRPWHGHRVV